MKGRSDRTICLVKITSPEDLAESIASAAGGRAAALLLLDAAVRYLRGEA